MFDWGLPVQHRNCLTAKSKLINFSTNWTERNRPKFSAEKINNYKEEHL